MKLYCAWHKKYFPKEVDSKGNLFLGDKEPLKNPARTDGICPRCYEKVEKEINEAKSASVII